MKKRIKQPKFTIKELQLIRDVFGGASPSEIKKAVLDGFNVSKFDENTHIGVVSLASDRIATKLKFLLND